MQAAESTVKSEWMDVATEIQQRVLHEAKDVLHVYGESMDRALIAFREAAKRHPDIALQVRWNRAMRNEKMLTSYKAPKNKMVYRMSDGFLADILCDRWTVMVAGSLS